MRKYWGLEVGHVILCTTEMDDRDILELGAIPANRDEGRITFIDRANKIIKREGNDEPIPFPDKFYTKREVEQMQWQVCRIGTHRCAGHEGH